MALPISGGILYLLFGNDHLTKKIKKRFKDEHNVKIKFLKNNEKSLMDSKITAGRMSGFIKYIQNTSSYPAYENTETKYYPFGALMFEDMITEISNAKEFIFMEYFVINEGKMWDRILEELIKKAQEGVDVRFIFDDLGAFTLFTNPYFSYLKSNNIKLLRFNPIRPFLSLFKNYRDHRKITVIDGHTGFTGGMNIRDNCIFRDERLGVCKETGVRVKGDVAWSFSVMFIETWNVFCKPDERINDYEAYKKANEKTIVNDGIVLPYGDSPLNKERLGENIYIDILNQSQHYVYIFTPYLIISERMNYALTMASKRGVDVRIITPSVCDNKIIHRLTRSYYKDLMESGVKIYEYLPGFIHAKSFISDDEIAVVGTINLDYRSLYLHFECATLLCNTSTIHDIKKDAVSTMNDSLEINLSKKRRTLGNELFDSILHLFAPLL